MLVSPPSPYFGGIEWIGMNNDYGTMFYWPGHSGANGELLINAVGATMALISDEAIQHGLESWPMYEYYQHSALMHPANTNLGGSVPLQFAAWVYQNGVNKMYAGSLDPNGDYMPTMYFDALSTNGSGAWRWFARGFCPKGASATWHFDDEIFRITAGPDAGVRVSKRFILEQAPQVTLRASSPAIALDFAKGQCTQITNATASSASFYLTNATGLSTNYEQRVFVIHSGPGLNINWPADWNWMNAAPTNLSAGQLLRLQLESLGPYGSNVLASSSVGTDMCYAPSVMDADASSFLGRMGGATAGVSNAINLFVTSLKADGTWTNFDALYPFMAANASGNAQNLISAANSMSWHGAFATMNATGIQSDGSTGYGDTGWKPSNSNNVGMFMFSSSNGSGGYALGARNDAGPAVFAVSRSGNYYAFRLNNSQIDSAVMAPTPDTSPPHVFYAGRYSTSSCHVYSGINGMAASSTLSPASVPDYNVFICCVNDGDGVGPYAFWSAGCGCGLIQFVGLGQGALSQSQYQTLYNACVALNTDLGR
jgi:hypothetical protein